MKRLLLLLPLMIVAIICFAKEPVWLTERANEEAYVGIGSASMSESAWEEKARENAYGTNVIKAIHMRMNGMA